MDWMTGSMTEAQALLGFFVGLGIVVAFFIGAYFYVRAADERDTRHRRDD